MKISVVVPVHNETDNVALLIEEIHQALKGQEAYEMLFVNDGSTDDTLAKLQEAMKTYPHLRVLQHQRSCGQSRAVHSGVQAARYDWVATLDGDGQNDPADIPAMIAKLDEGSGYDLVCGYRAKRKDTTFKRLQSRIANFVRSRFVGDHVRDTGCTLKVMRRDCREALLLFNGMHRFIPALIRNMGWRVTEMPVNHRPRIHGVSKYGFGNRALRATMDMFGVRWLNSRRTRYVIREERRG